MGFRWSEVRILSPRPGGPKRPPLFSKAEARDRETLTAPPSSLKIARRGFYPRKNGGGLIQRKGYVLSELRGRGWRGGEFLSEMRRQGGPGASPDGLGGATA